MLSFRHDLIDGFKLIATWHRTPWLTEFQPLTQPKVHVRGYPRHICHKVDKGSTWISTLALNAWLEPSARSQFSWKQPPLEVLLHSSTVMASNHIHGSAMIDDSRPASSHRVPASLLSGSTSWATEQEIFEKALGPKTADACILDLYYAVRRR